MHFAENGARDCSSSHPLFDCESYLRAHPETKGNPLAAYLARRANPAPAIVTRRGNVPGGAVSRFRMSR